MSGIWNWPISQEILDIMAEKINKIQRMKTKIEKILKEKQELELAIRGLEKEVDGLTRQYMSKAMDKHLKKREGQDHLASGNL